MAKTMFEKIWQAHEVAPGLIYIDLHLVHEVTSPQAFDGLRLAGRGVRRADRTLATADHNTPTDGTPAAALIADTLSRVQVETLERNCAEFGIPVYSLGSERQGIVHVIGPELGVTQPGMTIVCGDSHTSTHGAFGALAFGIGTSEVEHVLATQCMVQQQPRSMRVLYGGELGFGVTAKDLILATLGELGVGGLTGHVVEYAGPAIERLSMEGPHDRLQHDDRGRRARGHDRARRHHLRLVRIRASARRRRPARSSRRHSRRGARSAPTTGRGSTPTHTIDANAISPQVTWGTNPGMVCPVTDAVPSPGDFGTAPEREAAERALAYMDLAAGTPIEDIKLDRVFIGSCTNSRIGDLRAAAEIVAGRQVADGVSGMVVPGSQQVKAQAEVEGLDAIFVDAGFEWRERRLLDVPGHEPRHALARRALRLDVKPQLRGTPGPRRAHASRVTADGRGGGRRRTFRRHPRVELGGARGSDNDHRRTREPPRPGQRRHRPDHAQAVPEACRAHRLRRVPLLRLGQAGRMGPAAEPNPRRRAKTSAAAHRASMRPGGSQDYGFRAIVAPSFADIFFSNCTKIGLLPVVLAAEDCAALAAAGDGAVDLTRCEVRFAGREVPFAIDDEVRRRLLAGLDDIGVTLDEEDLIARFEAERERQGPVTTAL